MRKIDYEKPFSEEDITWLRQAGFMSEEAIARHQEQFGADVPEDESQEDTATQSALDPNARLRGEPVPNDSHPVNISPDAGSVQAGDALTDDDTDDYDSWKVAELKEEVAARNKLSDEREDVTPVSIEGTGKEGAVTKQDVVKALRLWDQENPGVLDEEDASSK